MSPIDLLLRRPSDLIGGPPQDPFAAAAAMMAAVFIYGLLYRVRGDGLIKTGSTFLARIFWAIPFGVGLAVAADVPCLACLAAVIGAFVALLRRHAHAMDLGRIQPGSAYAPARGVEGDWLSRFLDQPWDVAWLPLGMRAKLRRASATWTGHSATADACKLVVIGAYSGLLSALPVAYWRPDALLLAPWWGLIHPVAYGLGWRFHPDDHHRAGEVYTGAFLGIFVVGLWLTNPL